MFARSLSGAVVAACLASATATGAAEAPAVNDTPARPGEWGFRPPEGSSSPTDPPGFVWRPQRGAVTYQLECARDAAFRKDAYRVEGLRYNCHCPPKTLGEGTWNWRFRCVDKAGRASAWSLIRSFTIAPRAAALPMPTREELLSRIPEGHPRLFVRPGQLPHLRKLARGELKDQADALVAACEKLLKRPPPTKEPPKYAPGTARLSEQWRKTWWGNRVYTVRALNGAATLAFTRLLTGNDDYGRLAKRILLDTARWDPKGATGYRYNDEAGMPYNYYFARTYTFVNDLLSDGEKAACRRVMTVRGEEMYRHMAGSHIWRPYGSHRNRAWHFLGEVGVAFLGEVPHAGEWVHFAMNVFYNAYPVWSDADGGWHEGVSYWRSYVHRFTWWADVMRVAMGVNAYRKPYFSKVGYYAMYLQPPGTRGGGFGDLCARRKSADNRALMTVLAAQAGNGHWQWYVDAHGGPRDEGGYIGFIRGALPKARARPPDDLPTSRLFRGTGQAMLNTNLKSAKSNVEIVFKSSPFGTQSHGYESNNSFLLYAFGERLLIRTGRRDIYGSKHHTQWMWNTRSTNCITVGGAGQKGHSQAARGEILGFCTSKELDYVAGEAGKAYQNKALSRFTRHILFVKPEAIVLYDRLEAPAASTFEWHLHAPTKILAASPGDVRVTNNKAAARVAFLAPAGLKLSLTDKFDPPPRPRVKLVEWHLTARTPRPDKRVEFVTLIRPHRAGKDPAGDAAIHQTDGGYALELGLSKGRAVVLLRRGDKGVVRHGAFAADADVAAVRLDAAGRATAHLTAAGRSVQAAKGPLPKP